MKQILLFITLLLIPLSAHAVNLYTNNFSDGEPDNNYTMIYFNGTTTTCYCSGGYGYVSETATGAKYSRWQYNLGSSWTDVAVQFTVKTLPTPATNTYMLVGVRSNGMDGTTPKCYYLQYYYNGAAYSFSLANTDSSGTPSSNTCLYANDVIKFTVSGNSQPILEVSVNNVLILSSKGVAGFYAACKAAGSIMLGVKSPTGVNTSYYAIDDLTVDEYIAPPTNTPTKTPTVTPTMTATASPTARETPWEPFVEKSVDLPAQPQAVCFYDNRVWVTGNVYIPNGYVWDFDPITMALNNTVNVGSGPQGICSFAGYVWASNFGENTISKIDPTTYAVTTFSIGGTSPQLMGNDGTYLWVGAVDVSNKNIAVKINPVTNAIVDTVYLGGTLGDPYSCVSDGTNMWFSLFNRQSVVEVDPVSDTILAQVSFYSDGITDLIYNSGYVLAAGYSSGNIFKINSISNSTSAIAVITPSSDAIYGLTKGGNNYYCTGYNNAIVYKIDSVREQVVGNTPVANTPQGICYGGDRVWITDALDRMLIRLNPGNDYLTPTPTPIVRTFRQKKNYYPTTWFWNK